MPFLQNYAIGTLRAYFLFQILIDAQSISRFSSKKKFSWIYKVFRENFKFYKKSLSIHLPFSWCHARSHTQFGHGRFSLFDVFFTQADLFCSFFFRLLGYCLRKRNFKVPSCKDDNGQFTMVPFLVTLSDQKFGRYRR